MIPTIRATIWSSGPKVRSSSTPGAIATVPSSGSSGAYDAASWFVKSAACPPWECPTATQRVPACAAGMLRAARTASMTLCASLRPDR